MPAQAASGMNNDRQENPVSAASGMQWLPTRGSPCATRLIEKVRIRRFLGGRHRCGHHLRASAALRARAAMCSGCVASRRLERGEFLTMQFILQPQGQLGFIGIRIHL